jgi:hypothetical protein
VEQSIASRLGAGKTEQCATNPDRQLRCHSDGNQHRDRGPCAGRLFSELGQQCASGSLKYRRITDKDEMEENLDQHCVPGGLIGVFNVWSGQDAFGEEQTRSRTCRSNQKSRYT